MLPQSVISRVFVGQRPPVSPLPAWLLADYIEESAEAYIEGLPTPIFFPPILERIVGELYHWGDYNVSEGDWWALVKRHTAAFGWCGITHRILEDTYERFWDKKIEVNYVLL